LTDRVQKNWQNTGLGGYSTEAILGTLKHYGVGVDESGFKTLAKDLFPLGIVTQWQPAWKGTGQFARFPLAAVQELWKRLEGDRLIPTEYAAGLAELMKALQQLIQGSPEAPVGAAFQKMKGFEPNVPKKDGKPTDEFVEEIFAHFDENGVRFFDELPEQLAKAGHVDDAQEFAELEAFLIPERAGLSKALIRAVAGEKDGAIVDLLTQASDPQRSLPSRMLAVDGMIHLEAYEQAKAPARSLLDTAEKQEDVHLALALCGRLGHLLEVTEDPAGVQEILERQERLQETHAKLHPHHT
jgi:hypothetical protein